jgi:carbonic anhydrase
MSRPCLAPLLLLLAAQLALPAAQATEHEAPAHAVRPVGAASSNAAASAAGKASVSAPATAPAEPASDAASAPADPMEQLRQRLEARLSGAKPIASRPGEVRLVVRSAEPAADPKTSAHAGKKPRAAAASSPVHAAEPHLHWGYDGAGGPPAWATLEPEYALCGSGQRQSPIDIRDGLSVDLEAVKFDYHPSHFSVLDNGHTLQVDLASGNRIEVGGRSYELQQFHFHRPSEERIDGRRFEMTLHLVHKDAEGQIAVVALLVSAGQPQTVVQQVWNNLPLERNDRQAPAELLDLGKLLPTDLRYYTYMGSLTTPPCTEGVRWIVIQQPITLSPEQIALFARIYPMNARPLQAADGRRILQSQ